MWKCVWLPRAVEPEPCDSSTLLEVWRFRRNRRDKPKLAGEEPGFFLSVLNPSQLVSDLVAAFVGGHLMVEGWLRSLDLADLPVSTIPPPGVRRHTMWSSPKQTVIVVPLTSELLSEIRSRVIQPLTDLMPEVDHVQIAKDGRLEFGAYDGFDFSWVSERVGEEILRDLKERHVLRDYSRQDPALE